MHTLRLLLDTTKYDEQVIDKRFYAVAHIHNELVKHAKRLLTKLKYNKEYQVHLKEYVSLLKKETLSEKKEIRKQELSSLMNDIRENMGLSKHGFESYIKVCAKRYDKCLSSQQVQKEAIRVWKGVEDCLFKNGKQIHFKKYENFNTIGGKSNLNGVKFDETTFSIEWIGLNIKCKLPKNEKATDYIIDSINGNISYCEIERKMFPNGWHYYVILYIKEDAPKKLDIKETKNKTGIDLGTSTIAAVSDDKVLLKELTPNCKKYNKQIQELSYRMDISRRLSNPNKYNPDGTIKKGNKDKWVYSKSYIKNRRRLKSIYRKKSAYIKQFHEQLCNELLLNSKTFIVENMNFKSLQRKAKKTERSDKISEIKQKDGTTKQVQKYKRKKRFGRSLNNRAPAEFLAILERKCKQYGSRVLKVDTKSFKASQYDHSTDTYVKSNLKDRSKLIDGNYVQRDLYSAFLLKNSNSKLTAPNRKKCVSAFKDFLKLQNELIEQMKKDNISMKQCFGF